MWSTTSVSKTLGIQLPIIQAPMAGGATPELVGAASNAGALGSFAGAYSSADDLKTAIRKIRTLTNKPFAVNLFIPQEHDATSKQIKIASQVLEKIYPNVKIDSPVTPYIPSFEQQLNIVIEEKVPIFSFTFGIPTTEQLEALKRNNTILIGTATNLLEAQLLERNGIDIIVAQGSEAGGHHGSFLHTENGLVGLMALIPQLVDNIKIPIVAAGGIMDARGIVAALTLGAAGVQMGTAFLTCNESGINPKYKEMLLNATHDTTVLTQSFSGKTARGINNRFIEEMQAHQDSILPFPIQNALTQKIRSDANKNNNTDFMSMWAGQGMALCKKLSACDLINELNQSVISLLKK